MDDPINNRDNFKGGIFYYNPDDERVLIKIPGTANRYVFNYASWQSYVFVFVGILLLVYAFFRSS